MKHEIHGDGKHTGRMILGGFGLVVRELILIGIPAALLHWLAPVFGLAALDFTRAAGVVVLFRIVIFLIRGGRGHSRGSERCFRDRDGLHGPDQGAAGRRSNGATA